MLDSHIMVGFTLILSSKNSRYRHAEDRRITFLAAGVLLVLAVIHFAERGFLLNNAYIYASLKERENMDKKPYYRQSAIVFLLLSAVFFIVGSSVVTQIDEILLAEIPVKASAIVYAVVSSVRISKQMK